jgi:hypothetical protein
MQEVDEIQVSADSERTSAGRSDRIAARFFNRSSATKIFKRGLDAYNHPDFYRQLGEQPDEITATAVNVLVARFGPPCGRAYSGGRPSASMPFVGLVGALS